MKRLTTLLCLILCMAMLVGCGASQPAAQAPAEEAPAEEAPAEAPAVEEKKIELVYAGIKTDEDPASIAMNVFKEEVEKNSDSITVKVYTNGALGQLNDLLSGMTDGTIDMMHNTLTCYPWVAGAEAFNVEASKGENVKNDIIARVSSRSQARAGDRIQVAIDASRIHLFDKDTQKFIIH